MLYVRFDGDIPVEVCGDFPTSEVHNHHWQSRRDWKSLKQVNRIARLLTATTGKRYLGVDEGSSVYPRFDIIEPFQIGDRVSCAFNGDYYPDGRIVKITPSFQITTNTGNRYLRIGNTSRWRKVGGTWILVPGHISSLNPSF